MNFLFLGVVGTTRTVIFEWINRTKNKALYVVMKNTCIDLYHYLNLIEAKWFILNLVGKAIIILAYCRLVKWMHHPITTLEKDNYVENSSPVETWNKDVCIKWLKLYGFNFEQAFQNSRSTIIIHKQSSLPLIEINKCFFLQIILIWWLVVCYSPYHKLWKEM